MYAMTDLAEGVIILERYWLAARTPQEQEDSVSDDQMLLGPDGIFFNVDYREVEGNRSNDASKLELFGFEKEEDHPEYGRCYYFPMAGHC